MSSLIGGSSSNVSNFDFKDDDMLGVVFGCDDSRVMVSLMNLTADKQTICSVASPKGMKFDFSRHWAFAVVESKLFATSGQPTPHKLDPDYPRTWVYPREVYVCDLRNAFTKKSSGHLEFELAATLQSPKISSLVVPYKNKIFFVANPGVTPINTETPCEVLHGDDGYYTVHPLQTPHSLEQSSSLDGHLVVRNKLYVRATTRTKQGPSLYCLDMDDEVWEAGGVEDSCFVPEMLKDVCRDIYRRPLNYVHGDKLFKWALDVDPSIPSFRVVNLKDEVETDLGGVVESMGLGGRRVMDGWVLPCGSSDDDVFCVMNWIQDIESCDDSIVARKFRLTDDDDGFDILTKTVTLGPFPTGGGIPFVGFTAAVNKVLRVGDYTSRFVKEEFETGDEENMKKFAEFCRRLDDADRRKPGYLVDPDEDKPYYLTRPEVDLSHLWNDTVITDYIGSSDDDGDECYDNGDG